eukprot:gene3861-6358_t
MASSLLRLACTTSLRPATFRFSSPLVSIVQTRLLQSAAPQLERYFTESHEWVDVQGSIATVGITDYAQKALGDIVYVDLPESGLELDTEDEFGSIESVKAASELIAPCNGTVTEVNEELSDSPGLVNESPEDKGWIIKLELSSDDGFGMLMSREQYEKFLQETRED